MKLVSQQYLGDYFINHLVQLVNNKQYKKELLLTPQLWNRLLNQPDTGFDFEGFYITREMLPDGEVVVFYEFNPARTTIAFSAVIEAHHSYYYLSLEHGPSNPVFSVFTGTEEEKKASASITKQDFLNEISLLYNHHNERPINEIVNDKLVFDKLSPEAIVDLLVCCKGLSEEEANQIIKQEQKNIEAEIKENAQKLEEYKKKEKKENRKKGRKEIFWGIMWMSGALLATLVVAFLAKFGGIGWYVGFTGAFAYGARRLYHGLKDQF